MDKFQDMYRIESARLLNWDYDSNAYYFVTICTCGRECYFGKIENSKMIMNDIGNITKSEWLKTPEIRPDMNLKLGEFVVMPNHFHCIIYIGENQYNSEIGLVDAGKDAMHCVSTNKEIHYGFTGKNKFGSQSKNLSSIMRGFKSAVTTQARKINPNFEWQSRFHGRIIRDKNEWYAKTNYIKNNPKNWNEDEFYL